VKGRIAFEGVSLGFVEVREGGGGGRKISLRGEEKRRERICFGSEREKREQVGMAKGSQSQASSTVSKGGSSAAGAGRTGPAGLGPRGSAAASSSSGLRKRRTSSSGSGGSGGSGGGFGGNGNMLRFYTDDAPGLKISPTIVLAMSLCFIGFVTALHVAGKLYNYKSGSA